MFLKPRRSVYCAIRTESSNIIYVTHGCMRRAQCNVEFGNLFINLAFNLRLRKSRDNAGGKSRSQDLPRLYWFPVSSPAFSSGQQDWKIQFPLHAVQEIKCSYVYWTVHHLDSWIKIDQLMSLALLFAQHVSNGSTFIFRSLRLCVGILLCRKLLKMNVLPFETCWANTKASDISWSIFIQIKGCLLYKWYGTHKSIMLAKCGVLCQTWQYRITYQALGLWA